MKPTSILASLATFALLVWGYHQAMFAAPTESTMGDIQRIFYYHVPSAWTAFACFIANLIASLAYLRDRLPAADAAAVATAEVGLVFCTVVLVTGPLWAKPVWGIWWTWDARLTSTLVLWLIYASYLLLRRFSTGGQKATLAAALAVFGFVDVIFVYMSIRWFRTQHPQPVIGGDEASGLDPEMRFALMVNFIAFLALAGLLVSLRHRLELLRQDMDEARALQALAAPGEGNAR